MKLFGIALCFLAALFFVEAKTAWAGGDQFTSTEIAAAKACDAQRVQTLAIRDAQSAKLDHRVATTSWLAVQENLSRLNLEVVYAVLTKPALRGILHREFPYSLTNRPPPSNS